MTAADLRRLLQPAPERDRLSRPASSSRPAFSGRRDRRRQLRRDRRRHRPRDLATASTIRARSTTARDGCRNWWTAADLKQFQARGRASSISSSHYSIEPRHPPQRQARARREHRRSRRREAGLPGVQQSLQRKPRAAGRSTDSRPSSSSSSRGASSAATRSAPRRSSS